MARVGKAETPWDELSAGLLKEDNKGTIISCSAMRKKEKEYIRTYI
jgi:hypothetical protein